ncbi:PREDICTED: uncharacterized protein LOC104602069 [Nelumbo nucifera]|uniref:Uncharacterized protein LOC104602069 n=1 Tax=Nelumbo nucifera TaxID=4432 RepID=A0A1U8AMH4_NELNU|nr:PREDICTED: uncharacterized protein LOC104602069 [Nelumbo nucifera]
MTFHKGDAVEICSIEEGFLGSHYVATVISLVGKSRVLVLGLYVDEVDAFHSDGWWVKRITRIKGPLYYSYFSNTIDEIAYPFS